MMRVLVVLCALAAMALAENAETSLKESPLYDDVLEQCKMMFGRCLQEARGNPIRIIQCSGQFGVCSTMTLVGCSKQCIPPLLLCNIGAVGNWIATFKCCADFIKCAIGGCIGPHGSTPAFSLEDKSEERAQDIMIESFVTSLPKSTPDYGLIKECKIMLDECNSLADGKIDRLKCFIQFGACLAAKTVDCGKKCIPPLTECRMAAKSKGSIADLIKCSIDFLQCMTGGCEEEYTVMDIDDYSPFETAVDLAILSETDNGIIEHFKQCKAAHTKCLETAAPGIKGKAQCFLKFGWCCATGVTGCSASCMPGMAICMMGAVGNWVKTFLCAANFVKCIKDQCLSTQELALTSTAVELRTIRYDFATCKAAHEQCLADAGSLPAKVKCWLVFGACVGKDLAHCAGACMPGFAICMMGATGDWLKVMSCATNFVKCAKDECFKNYKTSIPRNPLKLGSESIPRDCIICIRIMMYLSRIG